MGEQNYTFVSFANLQIDFESLIQVCQSCGYNLKRIGADFSRNIPQFGFIELLVLTANVLLAERAKNKLQALNME